MAIIYTIGHGNRSLADFIPGVMWSAKPDGSIDFANEFWFQFTGLTMAETEGWGWASRQYR